MKKYIARSTMIVETYYEVFADTPDEARRMAHRGDGREVAKRYDTKGVTLTDKVPEDAI